MNHPKRLFAGVAALALVAGGAVVAAKAQPWGTPTGGGPAAVHATANKTPGQLDDSQKATRKREVDAVLARRANAVLKGDQKTFLASVDSKQPQLVARQRLLFVNLTK